MAGRTAARAVVLPLLLCGRTATAEEHPVIELDLYRAVKAADVNKELANVDMATLPGLMGWLHTKAVGENTDGNTDYNHRAPQDRTTRLHDVDTVLRARMRIRNPDKLIEQVGSLYNWVDFGQWNMYEAGKAHAAESTVNDFGDFVGAQRQVDKAYPSHTPYYYMSVGGFCPNLEWKEKGTLAKPHGTCTEYHDGGGVIRGGHCPPGTVDPTGAEGCVYQYNEPGPKDTVSLDKLVGITEQDCGGRYCKGFEDWRLHCTNLKYKRRFNYSRRRREQSIIRSPVCVEYDIHPACASDCQSSACKALEGEEKELGLPFWAGRCSAEENQRRHEKLAEAFGEVDATETHELVAKDVQKAFQTCKVEDTSRMCHPNSEEGGMYCTRAWSGVCQACYIPNTEKPYPNAGNDPFCPWDILESPDYKTDVKPKCNSTQPSDLCCIYMGTCEGPKRVTPETASLDEDGFALINRQKDTEAMRRYLKRVAMEDMNAVKVDKDQLADFAYFQWGKGPTYGRTLATIKKDMVKFVTLPSTTEPPSTTPGVVQDLPSESTAAPAAGTGTAAPQESGSSGGLPGWAVLVIVLTVLVCLGAGGAAAYFLYFADSREEKPARKKGKKKETASREEGAPLVGQSPRLVAGAVPVGGLYASQGVPVATTMVPMANYVSVPQQVAGQPYMVQMVAPGSPQAPVTYTRQ